MKTVYKNCILLDGTENMQPIVGTDVAVENGIITQIGQVAIAKNDLVIDLSGKYLLPGLINLHVHLPGGGKPQNKPMNAGLLTKIALANTFTRHFTLNLCHANLTRALYSGLTTVRAVGGLEHIDSKLRNLVNAGKKDGARLLVSDYAIGVKNGHMVGSVTKAANTPEQAREMVEDLYSHNVDWIKLMITGGVMDAKEKGEPGVLMMPPEMIKAACQSAHEHGLRVAAHIQSTVGIRTALQNGVDTVEHGSIIGEEEIKLFKEKKAAFVCTLSPALPMSKFDRETLNISQEVQYNSNLVYNNMIKGAETALKNGIPVGLGTDSGCPYTTHYNLWRELHYFQKELSLSSAFVLFTATLQNARILGIDKETGSIEVGKSADFLITNQNPLDDFRAMQTPYMVTMKGKNFRNPKIKTYPACEKELDKYY